MLTKMHIKMKIFTLKRGSGLRKIPTFKALCAIFFLCLFFVVKTNGQTNSFTNIATFGPTNVNTRTYHARVIDYDNDGDNDFIFTDESNNLRLYLNPGNGVFTTYTTIISPGAYVLFEPLDVDNDGDMDFVGSNGKVYANNGSGTFTIVSGLTLKQNAGGGIAFLKAIDINNDGKKDIIWANDANTATSFNEIWLNTTSGNSINFSYYAGISNENLSGRTAIDMGDVDKDGDLDIVLSGGSAQVYLNNSGTFSLSQTLTNYSGINRFIDWDNDGDLDIIGEESYNSVGLLLRTNNSSGTFATTVSLYGSTTSNAVYGDLNGDGLVDAIVGSQVLINRGTCGVFVSQTLNNVPILLSDFTGDGKLDVYTANAYVQSSIWKNDLSLVSDKSAPGNALNFDGVNDYVSIPDANSLDLTSSYTIEAWIKPTSFSASAGIVSKYHSDNSNGYLLRLAGTAPYTGINFDGLETATGILEAGKWYHIAAVKSGSTRTLYINGVAVSMPNGSAITTAANTDVLAIGVDYLASPRYFNGSIDEVRIWNTARTASEITTNNKISITACSNTNLVAYYKFDNGTASGNNGSYYVANDLSTNNNNGILTNFSLISGAASNWVESYAMVVPTLATATGIGTTGFTVNWAAPTTGTVTNYLLDVSVSSSFSSFVAGYNALSISGSSTAYSVTGLLPNTTYYYRLRADKTSVTGQGAYSASSSATTLGTLDKLGLSTTFATSAYSLRLLNSSYTGPLVRIAIGSSFYDVYPDATANKAFSLTSKISAAYSTYNAAATGVTTNALSSIITSGVTNASGVIWYDQTGNGNDAYQATSSNQPQLVSAGSIITSSSKPAFQFANTNTHYFQTSNNITTTNASSVNAVSQAISSGASSSQWVAIVTQSYPVSGPLGISLGRNGTSTISYGVYTGSTWQNSSSTADYPTTPFIATGTYGNTSLNLYLNGRASITGTATAGLGISSPLIIGKRWDGTDGYNGYVPEVVVFASTLSNTDRALIEASQSNYYGISIYSTNTDAHLSALTSTAGILTPTFDSATTTYSASVTNATTSVTITPTTYVSGASVKVSNVSTTSGSASSAVSLSVGNNSIPVVVTALDGTTTKTYTVNITRAASTVSTLSALGISSGTLSPTFATSTTSYTATVGNAISSITITPVVTDATATVTVNGTTVVSGNASSAITLSTGVNTITIIGKAQDGTTTTTYTITVTRLASNTVYYHSFSAGSIVSNVYSTIPDVQAANITSSQWSGVEGTSFCTNNSGISVSIPNSGSSKTITLTLNIANGYKLNITGISLKEVSTIDNGGFSVSVNGLAYSGLGGGGILNACPGLSQSATTPLALSGTVTITVFAVNSGTGTQVFSIDDFTINGSLSLISLDNIGINSIPAASAYSLRKLSSSYTGNAIQVRRSSDNTNAEIGFTSSGDLDTASLKTFVGVGNGFVTIWYDQSGNNRDLTQTNTNRQPSIVSNGTLYRRSSMPTMYYDNFDDGMLYNGANYLTANPISVNLVAGSNAASNTSRRAVQGTGNWFVGPHSGRHVWYAGGGNVNDTAWSTTQLERFTVIQPVTDICTAWRNGANVTTGNNKGVPFKIQTGAEGAYYEPVDGFISEIIAFNTDLSATDRQSLETSQSSYYSNKITLPVVISDFNAHLQGSNTILNWVSTSEINVDSYNVQRSINGINFLSVGSVNSKGAGNYSYTDNISSIPVNTVYYRLQVLDKDGTSSYSKIATVTLQNLGFKSFVLYPNPVKSIITAEFIAASDGVATIRVLDVQGKFLKQQTSKVMLGNNKLAIDASGIVGGNYILEIISSDGKLQKAFIKE